MLGEGIIKGLAETARNFVGSYVEADRLTTVQYPEERLPTKEAARNFPFLVFDGNDPHAGMRCVACQICEKECPPQCIYIEKSKDKKPDYVGKPQFYPKIFDIDVSVCMSSSPTTADARDDADLPAMEKHQKPNFKYQILKGPFSGTYDAGMRARCLAGVWGLGFGVFS